jgi:hypothetical protein
MQTGNADTEAGSAGIAVATGSFDGLIRSLHFVALPAFILSFIHNLL